MLDALRKRIARLIAPKGGAPAAAGQAAPNAVRMYQASRASRLTSGWATSTTSADSELVSSLQTLRNRSRALMRDAPHAKRAKVIVQNNVVGSGIGLQAQVMSSRGELRESVNDALEKAFCEWSSAERCHTGGTLHFADLERALMGQVFEAGEIFVRKHARPFGDSAVPFALELIEPERLLEEFMQPVPQAPLADGAVVKMGIEVDRFGRPLAYWLRNRHPGDLQFLHGETNKVERVPADQIMHLRLVDRWPQTRGEPWLHAVARKLNDMDGYTEAEIVAARAAASYVFTIETPEPNTPLANQITATAGAATSKEVVVEAGMGLRLAPGEKWETHSPNRPNTALDPFMRYMLREVAAGTGVSYESLSRDYSQSNYSSSRLALLDDRDLWKMLQQWFIRNFREPLHREWLRSAVLAGAIPGIALAEYALDPAKFEAARFKPRGWSWVDPTKEVAAAKEALKAGFTTRADIIAATADGRDIEDIDRQRVRELDDEKKLGLEYDTSPTVYIAAETGSQKGTGAPPTPDGEGDIVGGAAAANEEKQRLLWYTEVIQRFSTGLVDFGREFARNLKPPQALVNPTFNVAPPAVSVKGGDVHVAAGDVSVDVQPAAAPAVTVENRVEPTPIQVAAPKVTVENRVEVPAPQVTVEAPKVTVEAPQVNVAAPKVTVENRVEVAAETETVTRYERDAKDELVGSRTRTRKVK